MISHINIKNFAIIKDLDIDLYPGLNIITGETGAGKSIIIEAISMGLGARADLDYIRTGETRAEISLVIDSQGNESIYRQLEELGIPQEDPVIIKREISAQGRSLCRVNGEVVPLSSLSKICKGLVDIHGQYDHQSLLNVDNHVNVLDLYAGEKLCAVKDEVAGNYRDYVSASSELMKLRKTLSDSARERDLLAYELKEIRDSSLTQGEDEQLENDIRIMNNSEKLANALSEAYSLLSGDRAALGGLSEASHELKQVAGYSEKLDVLCADIEDSYYKLEDTASELRKLMNSISFSETELNNALERQELINTLKRKYAPTIEGILEYADNAENSLNKIENADQEMKALEDRILFCKKAYDEAAGRLSDIRKQAAAAMDEEVTKELKELNFSNAEFKVCISEASPSENGSDAVEFMISANAGESLRPLAKVASGGELSRIMLALKRILADLDQIPTMIFDEIDTGISGQTAAVVSEKLKSISEGHQIICITHLPQIASKADQHYKIQKVSDEISTETTVIPLSFDERVEELARLISGSSISDTARAAARELIG